MKAKIAVLVERKGGFYLALNKYKGNQWTSG
jgi:hypothetical protein